MKTEHFPNWTHRFATSIKICIDTSGLARFASARAHWLAHWLAHFVDENPRTKCDEFTFNLLITDNRYSTENNSQFRKENTLLLSRERSVNSRTPTHFATGTNSTINV